MSRLTISPNRTLGHEAFLPPRGAASKVAGSACQIALRGPGLANHAYSGRPTVGHPPGSDRSRPLTRFLTTLAIIWRLTLPYFRSEDRWPGRLLLGAVIAIELAVVGVSVLINQWNARV